MKRHGIYYWAGPGTGRITEQMVNVRGRVLTLVRYSMVKICLAAMGIMFLGACTGTDTPILGVSNDADSVKPRVLVEKKVEDPRESQVTATPQADFVVIMENLRFLPEEIEVKKGETVRILVKNRQGEHSFVVPELGINTGKLAEGEEKMIVLEATQSGVFEIYCDVGNHHRLGMSGELQIKDKD